MIPPIAMRPTTTPTAMPTVLGLLEPFDEALVACWPVAVTTTVLGAFDVVEVRVEPLEPVSDAESRLPILFRVDPVK